MKDQNRIYLRIQHLCFSATLKSRSGAHWEKPDVIPSHMMSFLFSCLSLLLSLSLPLFFFHASRSGESGNAWADPIFRQEETMITMESNDNNGEQGSIWKTKQRETRQKQKVHKCFGFIQSLLPLHINVVKLSQQETFAKYWLSLQLRYFYETIYCKINLTGWKVIFFHWYKSWIHFINQPGPKTISKVPTETEPFNFPR